MDNDVLAASTADIDEDHVVLYLGHYDWGLPQSSYVLDLWIVHLLCGLLYMAFVTYDILFV